METWNLEPSAPRLDEQIQLSESVTWRKREMKRQDVPSGTTPFRPRYTLLYCVMFSCALLGLLGFLGLFLALWNWP